MGSKKRHAPVPTTTYSLGLGEQVQVSVNAQQYADDTSEDDDTSSHFSVASLEDETSTKKPRIDEPPAPPSGKCWGCLHHFGKSQQRGRDPIADNMADELEKNKDLPIDEICNILERIYYEQILKPKLARGDSNAMRWDASMIKAHITEHDMNPYLQLKQSIREMNMNKKLVQSRIQTASGDIDVSMVKLAASLIEKNILFNKALKDFS